MLGEKFKERYDECAGTSSRSCKGPGKYFQAVWDFMETLNTVFAKIGYNQHAVDYTLYICRDYGFDPDVDDETYNREPGETWRRRQVVAKFLRELASKIEEGEC